MASNTLTMMFSDTIKFSDMAAESYLESGGEGLSGVPLLEIA
jgi:hypothetical protein